MCGQCAKKGRECKESLPQHLNWAKSGQLCLPLVHTSVNGTVPVLDQECTQKVLSLVKSAEAPNGATFNKYRIRPATKPRQTAATSINQMPRCPPPTSIDRLCHDFIVAYQQCPTGFRLSAFSSRFDDVPRYLGQSTALDQAARCLIYSHGSFLSRDSQFEINSTVYHRALRSLQDSLNDPLHVSDSTTLCAVSLLGCAEILGNRFLNWNYIYHASGLATLVKAYGRAAAQDNLGKSIIYSAVGPIVSYQRFISRNPELGRANTH